LVATESRLKENRGVGTQSAPQSACATSIPDKNETCWKLSASKAEGLDPAMDI
jgi:hypothetical protein